jgi:tetratricopeptide (TPR) repeat protein
MEGAMSQLTGQFGGARASDDSELDAAQELMYRAWEEPNPAKRIALAHDALVRSANCADAYVLLAEEEADTVSRALEYYQEGVAAGERALGKEFFQEYAGHFWGLLETRPYMRAREGMARMLWRLDRKAEALEQYRAMLLLNPDDNQGVRYLLLDLLLQMEQYDQSEQLLKEYRDEWSAVWMYTSALMAYRRHGAKVSASRALDKALEQNPYVPPYLTGQKRIPNRRPDYMGMGDEREAIWYASEHLNYWRRTPGAVEWLTEKVNARPIPKKTIQRAGRQRKGKART